MTDNRPDRSQAMTTTREAALEAALTLARNRLQACAIDHPTGSREMAERSEWADEATAALATPATEPQGLVDNDTIDSFCLTLRRLVSDAHAERDRFGHIAATIRVNALHHGATNAEVEAMLSGEISFVKWIADKIEARPTPQPAAEHEYPDPLIAEDRYEDDQPAADTRVVKPLVWKPEDAPCTRFKAEALGGHMMIVELDPKTDPGKYSVGFDLGGLCFKFVLAEYDDFPPKYTAPAKFEGIEAAKAAAQADYETRILSSIIGNATPATSDKIAEAARDVLAERQRQISAEGWTQEHDDQHSSGQMALAAACYALVGSIDRSPGAFKTPLQNWPWQASWWKPTTPRRDLVKAGALIIAEIERLDRALAGKGE